MRRSSGCWPGAASLHEASILTVLPGEDPGPIRRSPSRRHGIWVPAFALADAQISMVRDATPFTPSPHAKSGLPDFATKHDRSRIYPTSVGEGGMRGSDGAIRNRRSPLTPPSPLRGEGVKLRARPTKRNVYTN